MGSGMEVFCAAVFVLVSMEGKGKGKDKDEDDNDVGGIDVGVPFKFQTSTERHAENTQSSSYFLSGGIPISETCRNEGQHGNDTMVVGIWLYLARMLSTEAFPRNRA